MIVKLKRRSLKYRDLTPGQLYAVIGIEADDFRLINDLGQPYLYPPALFVVVDKARPTDWVESVGDEGERYAYPREFSRAGFFEDYHDGDAKARSQFWRRVNGRLARAG